MEKNMFALADYRNGLKDGVKFCLLFEGFSTAAVVGAYFVCKKVKTMAEAKRLIKDMKGVTYYGNISDKIWNDRWDIVFCTREQAEHVLDTMRVRLKKNKIVTVGEYYRIANRTPHYTYFNYGWTNLDSATIYNYIIKGKRCWCIRLPEPLHIERH